MAASQVISVPQSTLADYCRRLHIARLALFGSVLRDDFRPDSDVDVLVEFERGHVPGLIGLGTMEIELSQFFGGRKVDLHTPGSLGPEIRETVLREAEVQFGNVEG